MLVGLLTATMLLGSPIGAKADQGKWWDPKPEVKREAKREVKHEVKREVRRAPARHEAYRAPVWRGSRQNLPAARYSRPWRGYHVYRDQVWVGNYYGYRGRPAYGWRYYTAPTYYYPTRVCYVRPLRFFISAGATIGGVNVHATYSDPYPLYGCNFCDARFRSYHSYERHVGGCGHAPDGFRVVAHDWDHDDFDGHGDQNWERVHDN
jgi:hypothetical protein